MNRPPAIQIQPSLLAADKARLGDECRRAADAGADALHLDLMDGHFVPNLSFGPDIVRMARRRFPGPLSVHLMFTRPDLYVAPFADAGATVLLIHVEASCDVAATLAAIRARGVRAGLTLNPETPAAFAAPHVRDGAVDEVLCMSVHPGFGGQSFLPAVLPKFRELRALAPALDLSVDGGIGEETAADCAAAGANVLIAGTTLFGAADMAAAVRSMRARAEAARAAGGAAP